jgi:hypothetical protein
MYGVAVFGHDVTLSHLDIGGVPKDDITISGRANGNAYAGNISVIDSTLSGAARNAISVTGAIGLRIERNTIQGVRDSPPGQPAAGIDVEPDTRDRPASDLHIVGNTIQDNAGPGILLELEPNEGPAVLATGLEIAGNTIVRNALDARSAEAGGDRCSPAVRTAVPARSCSWTTSSAGTAAQGYLETHFQLVVESSGQRRRRQRGLSTATGRPRAAAVLLDLRFVRSCGGRARGCPAQRLIRATSQRQQAGERQLPEHPNGARGLIARAEQSSGSRARSPAAKAASSGRSPSATRAARRERGGPLQSPPALPLAGEPAVTRRRHRERRGLNADGLRRGAMLPPPTCGGVPVEPLVLLPGRLHCRQRSRHWQPSRPRTHREPGSLRRHSLAGTGRAVDRVAAADLGHAGGARRGVAAAGTPPPSPVRRRSPCFPGSRRIPTGQC